MAEEITEEAAELVARVAALDVGKASLVACVRVPHENRLGARRQEVRTFATTTRSLLELQDWLVAQGVSLCVMEATSTYWKPPFYLLEGASECWVFNAAMSRSAGPAEDRPAGCGLAGQTRRAGDDLRPSSCPPRSSVSCATHPLPRTLTQARTGEKQRVEKLLEDAQLTELRGRIAVSGRQAGAWVAMFPAHDQRRGWRAGPVLAEGAALRCA